MGQPSSEHKIGRVLLFVNGALASLSALLLLVLPLFMAAAIGAGAAEAFLVFGMFFVLGVLSIAGAVVSFIAASKAPLDPHRAGILGIVATFLPPTNVVALAGGILLLISPEAKAQQAHRGGTTTPTAPPPVH